MNWTLLFREGAPGKAAVYVWDTHGPVHRYVIGKHMQCPDGSFRATQAYRERRPAALNYARAWLARRTAPTGGASEERN